MLVWGDFGRGKEHEVNFHEAEAEIALIFSAKFHFDPIFSKKLKFSTGLQ